MDSQQVRKQFFSEQNEGMILGMLTKSFQQRLGSELNEKHQSHLERAVEFYMSDIFQRFPNQPVQSLNKQVITSSAGEFSTYLQRENALTKATPQMFRETSARFEQLGQERRTLEAPRPSVPNYVQPIQLKESDEISAITLFEEAKKRRGGEMNAMAESEAARRLASAASPVYAVSQERADPRSLFDSPLDLVVAGAQSLGSGIADANPTIARPGTEMARRGTLQQDLIIKQQDIQTYKETEYNLSIYSADRKWEFNTSENRYNFSVNLYSGNDTNGLTISPIATSRFKNIVKIEFVKAILPIENTSVIVRKTMDATSHVVSYDTTFLKDVFGFPFLVLNIDELDNNNYGTNNVMDNAFAILQYDANWTDNTSSMGFTGFIPKHMKCQRIYSPTPLATLNKLTMRLEQPNGSLVSLLSDTLDIKGAFLSITADMVTYTGVSLSAGPPYTNFTPYYDGTGEYIWIDCTTWFTKYQVAAGDRIQIRNLSLPTNPSAALVDLVNFLQNTDGLMVVDTAYNTGTSSLTTGSNSAGYARFIIVRGKFADPTTGSTSVSAFGGAANNTTLSAALATSTFTSGRLINLSHQTQFTFRIITRDYDSTSLMRPDNL